MQQQQRAACDAAAGGLGDPSTWTSYTPVHLLPMVGRLRCVSGASSNSNMHSRRAMPTHLSCLWGSQWWC